MDNGQLKRLEDYLWPKGLRRDIWMIVDGARDRRIFSLLLECFYTGHVCLFAGTLAPELEMNAPYLIQLQHDDAKTRKFLTQAWGNSWGILLKCATRLESLRRHLRGLLTVRDPSGQKLLFRFYDPRVLRIYLPTCNTDELEQVFGPIERFWTEDETSANLLEFQFSGAELLSNILPVSTAALAAPGNSASLPHA